MLNERLFTNEIPSIPGYEPTVPTIISMSNVASYTGDAETINVTGSAIHVPKGFFGPGATFRFTLAGSRTGTAGASTVIIVIGATTVLSVAVPTETAVDWMGQFVVSAHTDFAHQNCFGSIQASATVLSIMDYAAATVNTTDDVIIKAQLVLASASDEVTVNFCMVEYWKI